MEGAISRLHKIIRPKLIEVLAAKHQQIEMTPKVFCTNYWGHFTFYSASFLLQLTRAIMVFEM